MCALIFLCEIDWKASALIMSLMIDGSVQLHGWFDCTWLRLEPFLACRQPESDTEPEGFVCCHLQSEVRFAEGMCNKQSYSCSGKYGPPYPGFLGSFVAVSSVLAGCFGYFPFFIASDRKSCRWKKEKKILRRHPIPQWTKKIRPALLTRLRFCLMVRAINSSSIQSSIRMCKSCTSQSCHIFYLKA